MQTARSPNAPQSRVKGQPLNVPQSKARQRQAARGHPHENLVHGLYDGPFSIRPFRHSIISTFNIQTCFI